MRTRQHSLFESRLFPANMISPYYQILLLWIPHSIILLLFRKTEIRLNLWFLLGKSLVISGAFPATIQFLIFRIIRCITYQNNQNRQQSRSRQPLDSENEKEDPKDQKNITTEEALAIFRGLTSEQTGLSQLLDHYFFYIPEQTEEIMDHRRYAILVYSSVQDRLFLDARFYMTLDGSTIYKQAHSSEDLEIFSLK